MSQPHHPLEVFISYSHKDDDLRKELVEHMSLLRRDRVIHDWHDRLLAPGDDWAGVIDARLDSAKIVLLLVSASFLASDYCYDIEMARAIERHDAGDAIVIPIILRACAWQRAPFGKLQAFPRDDKAVTSWANRDEAFKQIAEAIRAAAEKLQAVPAFSAAAPMKAALGPLLPYLCDRNDQEKALGPALRAHLETRPRRPFVCLIHGDEREEHGWFLDRLREHWLPATLSHLGVKVDPLPEIHWTLPHSVNRHEGFWEDLGQAALGTSAALPREIHTALAAGAPQILRAEILIEKLEQSGEELLKRYLEFCDRWDDLPPGRAVIHFVSLKYHSLANKRFWERRRLRGRNEELRAFVAQKIDFSQYGRLSGIALPELRSIPRNDVVDWSRSEPVRRRRRIEEREIRALYERKDLCNEDGHIPMDLLGTELKRLLEG
ncbi:MAG: TIR domain-containing protein [Blastocatellia bacterium]|nr:TIR domain-containing protein [Blastocatellia bacterium]